MKSQKKKVLRTKFPTLTPDLQISFHHKLLELKKLYLNEALSATISKSDITEINTQLAEFVSGDALKRVASFGLRGELFYAIPYLLNQNPYLLGYYRLLLGFSQKEFYGSQNFSRFKRLEEAGEIPNHLKDQVAPLCVSLSKSAEYLIKAIEGISLDIIHELQLLTIGPQLRGAMNTVSGQRSTNEVFRVIENIVDPYVVSKTKQTIVIKNESNRNVIITFSSDPDISIIEELESQPRPLVSIEIKGGTDFSNIHNRLGEAEKSHQKAKNRGFFEFWTMIRVKLDQKISKRESPTTSHFFHIDEIIKDDTADGKRFRDLLCSNLGIKT